MLGHLKRSMSLVLSLTLCTLSLGTIASATASSPPHTPLPLPRSMGGEEAIRALGPSLAAVAAAHGRGTAELARALQADNHLKVDRNGRLFFQDVPAPAGAEAAAVGGAPFPLDQTFQLHSLPGSNRTIYLDFDGHLLTETMWNVEAADMEVHAPAWDIEGGPDVFTSAERQFIQQVWQRVAEDYAPFDVDVTTELVSEDVLTRASLEDDLFGVRVLVSPLSPLYGQWGGLAYVDVFDMTSDFYKPALVFPEMLRTEKNVAEAITHEAGHTLGLLHDGLAGGASYFSGYGTGETSWAPIMGTAYNRNLSQWSKGEYAGADNQEDDLAMIQSGGCPLRADDHADSTAGAQHLDPRATVDAAGIINTAQDVDVVALTCGSGVVSLAAAPAAVGPNLDIRLELRDGAGTLLASDDPADRLAASFDFTVSGGSYYVYVVGTGKDDPAIGYTDYGSIGTWTLTGTVPSSDVKLAPTATATASCDRGAAPLAVTLDGSQSYDPDGTIVSWEWALGDGSSASGVAVEHTYADPGVYVATLTVTDSDGLIDTCSAVVAVTAPNAAPVAVASSSVSEGTAPLAVTFDGTRSYDPDGTISSWEWIFDDGYSAGGATVTRAYASPGAYSATLRVTDDEGAVASTAVQVQVSESPTKVIRVDGVQIRILVTSKGRVATAYVRVVDQTGVPVEGVTVAGEWSGVVKGSATSLSKEDGWAELTSHRFRRTGIVTFSVTGISKPGYVREPDTGYSTSVLAAATRYR